jgi:molybdopterin-guanine dinucleotide biosynthesis protein B
MIKVSKPYIFQVVGYKNTGKTTLMCKLIKQLSHLGFRVGTIKHDAHEFEMDHPGKDTWKHKESGAHVVAITSKDKTAIIEQSPTSIEELIKRMKMVDIILIEGFKNSTYPKIVMIKDESQLELLQNLQHIIAVATWYPLHTEIFKTFHIDDEENIMEQIIKTIENSNR